MTTPEDHRVLDGIVEMLRRYVQILDWSRESECVEFYDGENRQWYEIVVRPIDVPEAAKAEEDE